MDSQGHTIVLEGKGGMMSCWDGSQRRRRQLLNNRVTSSTTIKHASNGHRISRLCPQSTSLKLPKLDFCCNYCTKALTKINVGMKETFWLTSPSSEKVSLQNSEPRKCVFIFSYPLDGWPSATAVRKEQT